MLQRKQPSLLKSALEGAIKGSSSSLLTWQALIHRDIAFLLNIPSHCRNFIFTHDSSIHVSSMTVALRGLSWPHFMPTNREKSQSPQSAPSSPIARPSSIKDLILQIEARQDPDERRSMEEDRPSSPNFHSYYPRCTHLNSAVPIQGSTSENTARVQNSVPKTIRFTKSEEECIFGPYARLPTPPEGSGEDIGLDFNPHLPPYPMAWALEGANDLDNLPPIPDSPLAIAQLEFGNRSSFNTQVRDLIQEEPDRPIGGIPAAAAPEEKRSFNVGSLAIKSKDYLARRNVTRLDSEKFLDGYISPRVRITKPSEASAENLARKGNRALLSTSNFSDPFQKRAANTDLSHDGPGLGGTAVKDFGNPTAPHEDLDPSISPTSTVPELLPSLPAGDSNVASSSDALPNPISNVTPDVGTLPGGDSNITTYLDTLPDTTDVGPLPVPLDVTGELPIPGTPLPLDPSGGKKPRLWHKGRKLLLRKPVLVLIVGRQLAEPTKQALHLISTGVPINSQDITGPVGAGAPVPGSIPGL
jgi:hypothetical protein